MKIESAFFKFQIVIRRVLTSQISVIAKLGTKWFTKIGISLPKIKNNTHRMMVV